MYKGKKVFAVIPARGGSKGIPGKNIIDLGGKPLLAWTIEAARKSRYIDRLILSSDDAAIIEVARQYGCEAPFVRPSELARDETPGIEPVFHAIENVQESFNYVVLLQPTSPFRNVDDIDGCIEMAVDNRGFCVSLYIPEKSPYWMYKLDDQYLKPLLKTTATRRQDLPDVYSLNGAVYVADIHELYRSRSFINEDTAGYIMPAIRSVDIDNEIDLLTCKAILDKNLLKET